MSRWPMRILILALVAASAPMTALEWARPYTQTVTPLRPTLPPKVDWTPVVLRSDSILILGDSIARGTCCSTYGPTAYLPHAINRAVNGNQIAEVTALLQKIPAKRVFLHVGVNDVGRDNPNAERDWTALLGVMKARPQTHFVIVEIGPMNPRTTTPAQYARRDGMNASLRGMNATNVTVLPFVATHFADGLHPNDAGYRQQMALVLRAFHLPVSYPPSGYGVKLQGIQSAAPLGRE